jgi:hypothetical protein
MAVAESICRMEKTMLKTLAIAAALTAIAASSAMADQYCGPGYYYSNRYNDCIAYGARYYTPPGAAVGGAVNGAGYVAGSAVNAAGNVAGAAVGTAGAIVGGVLGH